jgi:hypothetical protein
VHRGTTRFRRAVRQYRSIPILALAVAFAAVGVWLSVSARPVEFGLDGSGIHVDGVTLTRIAQSGRGSETFTGAATMVIDTAPSGVVTAAAVMNWNGLAATGRCVLRHGAATIAETCTYELGLHRLTSTDRFSVATRTWHREYGDGVGISIVVPAGSTVIPIPFPLGR